MPRAWNDNPNNGALSRAAFRLAPGTAGVIPQKILGSGLDNAEVGSKITIN
jgi:hypothetical protein